MTEYTWFQQKILSPTQKAATQLAQLLPGNNPIGREMWHIFHLETVDYTEVVQTIRLACGHKQQTFAIVPVDTFYNTVITEDTKSKKNITFDFKKALVNHPADLLFVCLDRMERGVKEREGDFDAANQKKYFHLMRKYIASCEEQYDQRLQRVKEQFSYSQCIPWDNENPYPTSKVLLDDWPGNHILFICYGKDCTLPSLFTTSLKSVHYPPLTTEDFRILLTEYTLASHIEKQYLLQKYGSYLDKQHKQERIDLPHYSDALLDWYTNYMAGMQEQEVRYLLAEIVDHFPKGTVDFTQNETAAEPIIVQHKNQRLKQSGYMAAQIVSKTDSNKGQENIENWFATHIELMKDSDTAPKGIALVGLPGTGKTATAKMAAELFQLPLVKFEIASILGGRVGDSEKGMQNFLRELKYAAPCVLLIDEIEKAISGADGNDGSGVMQRLFGMLLTFMQDNKRPVFTVATANRIDKIPPELFRSGRFDQVFCLMMPEYQACCDIMESKLNKYSEKFGFRKRFDREDAAQLFDSCVGTKQKPRFLTGADIDARAKELFSQLSIEKKKGVSLHAQENMQQTDFYVDKMRKISDSMRVQAEPESNNTMMVCAKIYLAMLRGGMTDAGKAESPLTNRNLNEEGAQYFFYDPAQPEKGPYCLWSELPPIPAKENASPKEWYDTVFYHEIQKYMCEVIIADRENTMEPVRNEYLKWKKS